MTETHLPRTVFALLLMTAVAAVFYPAAAQDAAKPAAPAKPAAAKPAAAKPAAAKPAAPAAAKPAAKPAPKPAATGGDQPVLLGQYGDWGAYKATPGGKTVCFALAKPASATTTPAGR